MLSSFQCSSSAIKVEKLARTLFLWKIEVHEQKEKVYEMRRWNEALVSNMLPEHVARHFLGSKKRDEVMRGEALAHRSVSRGTAQCTDT